MTGLWSIRIEEKNLAVGFRRRKILCHSRPRMLRSETMVLSSRSRTFKRGKVAEIEIRYLLRSGCVNIESRSSKTAGPGTSESKAFALLHLEYCNWIYVVRSSPTGVSLLVTSCHRLPNHISIYSSSCPSRTVFFHLRAGMRRLNMMSISR
jgi:hypothetical protein